MAAKAKVLKVAISVPNESYILTEAYDNHIEMLMHVASLMERWKHEKRDPHYEVYWHTTGRLMTAMARERLINVAMEGGMDYILMFDDDMMLPIDTIECMLLDMEQHPEIDILAPLAFMRNPPHYAVIYTADEGYDQERHTPYHRNNFNIDYPRDSLVECDAVGFGAVLINMRIFKKMQPPYCFSTTGAGEDLYLCFKARKEANARIFMDTRIKLGHLGHPQVIDEAYRDKYAKEHDEK